VVHEGTHGLIAELDPGSAWHAEPQVLGFLRLKGSSQIQRRGDPPDVGNKVQDVESGLAFTQSEATTKLLDKDPTAMRHTQEGDEVDVRDINAFIEDINACDHWHAAKPELVQEDLTGLSGHATMKEGGALPCRVCLSERLRHMLGVLDRLAEQDGARIGSPPLGVPDVLDDLLVTLRQE